jgi:hypothetical protein
MAKQRRHPPKSAASRTQMSADPETPLTMHYENIPVAVVIPENQYTDYADAFTIAHTSDEFVISFLQLQHPVVTSKKQLDAIKHLETICIARIALTPKRMLALMGAMQENFRTLFPDFEKAIKEAEAKAAAAKDAPKQEGD